MILVAVLKIVAAVAALVGTVLLLVGYRCLADRDDHMSEAYRREQKWFRK